MSQALSAPELLRALAGLRFGHPLYLYRQIGSTNDEARRLAQAGGPEGLLVAAEEQLAGRGRAGRRWITPHGTALALSLVLRPALPAEQANRLAMLAGVAVCEALEQVAGLAATLKWPNDVLLSGRKVGGILVESALAGDQLDFAVLGLGLNVSAAPPADQVEFPATSVEAEAGQAVDRVALLRAIIGRLEDAYPHLSGEAAGRLYRAWSARLTWLGERVVAFTPNGEYHGRAEGTEPDGALIVRLDSGEALRVMAGDVRLRPAGAGR